MKWVKFMKAEQAQPGVKMRPEPISKRPGRYKSMTVLRRQQRVYFGNLIIFEDGSNIPVADAKGRWLVADNARRNLF